MTGTGDPATASAEAPPPPRSGWQKLLAVLTEELRQLQPRLLLFAAAGRLLPRGSLGGLRATLLRAMGSSVGKGTRVLGLPQLTGDIERPASNLTVGAGCLLAWGCVFELGERLTIGEQVSLEAEVMVLTTSHELGPREHRAGPRMSRPVIIGRGASLGARAIVLPGVTIGEGAVVLPGSVVSKSVAPGARVGGIPARLLAPLSPPVPIKPPGPSTT